MRQLTYVSRSTIEWWDVPAPKLQDDRDALVQPLAVTRCDLDLLIAGGKSGLPGLFALGHETAGRVGRSRRRRDKFFARRSRHRAVPDQLRPVRAEPIGLFPIVVDAAATDASILLA